MRPRIIASAAQPRQPQISHGILRIFGQNRCKLFFGFIDLPLNQQEFAQPQTGHDLLISPEVERTSPLGNGRGWIEDEQDCALEVRPARLPGIQTLSLAEARDGFRVITMGTQDHAKPAPGVRIMRRPPDRVLCRFEERGHCGVRRC